MSEAKEKIKSKAKLPNVHNIHLIYSWYTSSMWWYVNGTLQLVIIALKSNPSANGAILFKQNLFFLNFIGDFSEPEISANLIYNCGSTA